MGDRTYSFDANLVISDGATAITANSWATYAGSQGIVDLLGNQSISVTLPSIDDVSTIYPQQPRFDGALVLDVTAITTSSSNLYKIFLVGSNDPAFAGNATPAGNVVLAAMELGTGASLDIPVGFTTPAPAAVGGSRYELLFSNEQNNVKFEFVSVYVVVSGSSPSITFRAFVAVIPRI